MTIKKKFIGERRSLIIISICFLLMLSNRSFADDVNLHDGNHLLDKCSKAENIINGNEKAIISLDDSSDVGYCFGLMWGAYVPLGIFANESKFCPPEKISIEQLERIVTKYLRDHPEELHKDEALLAEMAILKAFPCKKGK